MAGKAYRSCHFLISECPSAGEAISPIVVIGGHVAPLMHPIDKSQMVTVVDGIRVFIQKDILVGGRNNGRLLTKGIKSLSISSVYQRPY